MPITASTTLKLFCDVIGGFEGSGFGVLSRGRLEPEPPRKLFACVFKHERDQIRSSIGYERPRLKQCGKVGVVARSNPCREGERAGAAPPPVKHTLNTRFWSKTPHPAKSAALRSMICESIPFSLAPLKVGAVDGECHASEGVWCLVIFPYAPSNTRGHCWETPQPLDKRAQPQKMGFEERECVC